MKTTALYLRGTFSNPLETWRSFLRICSKLELVVVAVTRHDSPGGGVLGTVLFEAGAATLHTSPETGSAWAQLVVDAEDLRSVGAFQSEIAERWLILPSEAVRMPPLRIFTDEGELDLEKHRTEAA